MGALPNIPPEMMQQLSGMVDVPLVRFAARYWWITVPIGYAGWMKYQERRKKGEATLPNIIADLSPLIGVVATLVMLNHTLAQREAAPPPIVPAGPVRDADFSTNSKPVAGIGGPRAA